VLVDSITTRCTPHCRNQATIANVGGHEKLPTGGHESAR
jgi:hypothetical protein